MEKYTIIVIDLGQTFNTKLSTGEIDIKERPTFTSYILPEMAENTDVKD